MKRRAVLASFGALVTAPFLPKLPVAAEVEAPLLAVDWGVADVTTSVWMQAGRVFFVSQGGEVFEFSDSQDHTKWS